MSQSTTPQVPDFVSFTKKELKTHLLTYGVSASKDMCIDLCISEDARVLTGKQKNVFKLENRKMFSVTYLDPPWSSPPQELRWT